MAYNWTQDEATLLGQLQAGLTKLPISGSVKALGCCAKLSELLAYAAASVNSSKTTCFYAMQEYYFAYLQIKYAMANYGDLSSGSSSFSTMQSYLHKANQACAASVGKTIPQSIAPCTSSSGSSSGTSSSSSAGSTPVSSSATTPTPTPSSGSPATPATPAASIPPSGSGSGLGTIVALAIAGLGVYWLSKRPKKARPKPKQTKKAKNRKR